MCSLQDDIVKFVSKPASPPRLVEIPEEGKGKAKERREVGEGDDTVIVEDTSDEEDGETLQDSVPAAIKVQPPWTTQCSSHPRSSG
jgi:hypothetical protein